MLLVDTIATILLFIVLIGWVLLSIYAGYTSIFLSDRGVPGIALVGLVLAVVGIPLSVIAVYVIAAIRAWNADGYTFYYPLVAFVVGTVAAALVLAPAGGSLRSAISFTEATDSVGRASAVTRGIQLKRRALLWRSPSRRQ